ncbi:Secreted-like protein [Daphnia magna]|uniref:Secreted-like protein n=1 Tax=Daphnia magna TaxID=35525 RepID=A0A164WE40_9CRUS|nr:Secreted-like protein [Daphnia magna]
MQRVNGAVLMAAAMLATFWATGVDANSHGAPITACADMGTVHTEVNKGGIVQVTLSANAVHDDPQSRLPEVSGYFTGYLLMAFNAEDEEAGPIGTFSGFNPKQGQHLNCWDRPMSALTHVNPNFKPTIHTQWVPPEEFVGTVIFRATFTSNIATIWAAVPAHSNTEVKKGSKVNVTLSAHVAHDDPRNRLFQVPGYFTGYLLMAFNAKDEMAGPIGTFSGFNPVHGQHLNCWNRPMSALTHVNANFKSVIHTQWVPPENFVGTVIFSTSP